MIPGAMFDDETEVLVRMSIGLPLLYLLLGALILRWAVGWTNGVLRFDESAASQGAVTRIPSPSMGWAIVMMLLSLAAHAIVSGVAGLCALPIALVAEFEEGPTQLALLMSSVASLVVHFLARSWLWTKMLPTSFERATVVVLLETVLGFFAGIVIGVLLGVAFTIIVVTQSA
jgi:hypothetical protein